jgi:gamma-glutamyl:cysteine ligase YbdK (ATP-grasp superfamily)
VPDLERDDFGRQPNALASAALLAVSAKSPFLRGRGTGLGSARTRLFQAVPRMGIPRA